MFDLDKAPSRSRCCRLYIHKRCQHSLGLLLLPRPTYVKPTRARRQTAPHILTPTPTTVEMGSGQNGRTPTSDEPMTLSVVEGRPLEEKTEDVASLVISSDVDGYTDDGLVARGKANDPVLVVHKFCVLPLKVGGIMPHPELSGLCSYASSLFPRLPEWRQSLRNL